MVLNRNFSCINNDDLWSLKGVTKEDENDKRSVLLMIVISILVAMTVGGNQSVHMNWWFQIWEWTPQHRPPTTNREWTNKMDDWVLWLCQLIHCAVSLCATHPSPAPIRFYWFRAFSRTDHRPLKNTFTVVLGINLRHPISVDGRRMMSWGD